MLNVFIRAARSYASEWPDFRLKPRPRRYDIVGEYYAPYCFTLVRRWMADALHPRKCFDHLNPQVEHSLLCGRRRGRRYCPG